MSLAVQLGLFLCGVSRAGQLPQRPTGEEERERGTGKGMLYGHGRVPMVWSAGSGEHVILEEGKVSQLSTHGSEQVPLEVKLRTPSCPGCMSWLLSLPNIPPTHGQTPSALFDSCQAFMIAHILSSASLD